MTFKENENISGVSAFTDENISGVSALTDGDISGVSAFTDEDISGVSAFTSKIKLFSIEKRDSRGPTRIHNLSTTSTKPTLFSLLLLYIICLAIYSYYSLLLEASGIAMAIWQFRNYTIPQCFVMLYCLVTGLLHFFCVCFTDWNFRIDACKLFHCFAAL